MSPYLHGCLSVSPLLPPASLHAVFVSGFGLPARRDVTSMESKCISGELYHSIQCAGKRRSALCSSDEFAQRKSRQVSFFLQAKVERKESCCAFHSDLKTRVAADVLRSTKNRVAVVMLLCLRPSKAPFCLTWAEERRRKEKSSSHCCCQQLPAGS